MFRKVPLLGVGGALVAIALLAPSELTGQSGPPSGAAQGGGPPQGRPTAFRPPNPIARDRLDDVVRKMFVRADTNRDGLVTLAEVNSIVEARKEAAISARFATVDVDRNQCISPAEFQAWQRKMGTLALSEVQSAGQAKIVPDHVPLELGIERNDIVLGQLIDPLSATTIVAANTNYDGGASLEELLVFQRRRFDSADVNRDAKLSIDEIRGPARKGASGPFGGPPLPDGAPPDD